MNNLSPVFTVYISPPNGKSRYLVIQNKFPFIIFVVTIYLAVFIYYHPFLLFSEYNNGSFQSTLTVKSNYNSTPEDFLILKADYFSIYYEPGVALKTVYRKINRRSFYTNTALRLSSLNTVEEKLVYRVSLLYEQVKELLGMYIHNVKFKIKIYKNRQSLCDKFFRITGKRQNVKAFYSKKDNTIYTSEADISDSVMVHELTHLVVSNYFIIQPPNKVSEMMTTYVDSHFEDRLSPLLERWRSDF